MEQAIFTSAATARGEGYQLVAASRGVSEADAQVLALWCPSHGALVNEGPGGQSIQFHRLPSGAYCIARTRPLGQEYSGRRGERLHTHCLIVSPESLAKFSNNPFAVLQAAVASGRLVEAERSLEGPLDSLALLGRAGACQEPLVQRVAEALGPARLGMVMDEIVHNRAVGLCGGWAAEELIATVFNCLPLECRLELSFATGLKFSPQRPFRIVAVDGDLREQHRLARQFEVALVQVEQLQPMEPPQATTWGGYVAKLLTTQGVQGLSATLVRPHPGLTCDELPQLVRELEEERAPPSAPVHASAETKVAHAHAAHLRRRTKSATGKTLIRPAKNIGANQAMIEQLEALDDAVYDSIAGKPGAMDNLTQLWPQVLGQLEPKLVDQSREQYLRYAINVWESFLESSNAPDKAMAALDVLCLMFDAEAE